MARLVTANNRSDPDLYQSSKMLPPWERGNVVQVPYMDATSPSLSNAERDALPSLWAAQTNHPSSTRPKVESHVRYGSNSSQRRETSSDDCINPRTVKNTRKYPPTALPYDTPIYIPPGSKSTPCPPTFTRPPPTPPDSEIGSTGTTSTTGSPPSREVLKPLPQVPACVEPDRPSRSRQASSTRGSRKPKSRLQRWKSAFKDMFTHHAVNESDYVHISAQGHWTDE